MKYWFEKREKGLGMGWGLFPIAWQGFFLMALFLVAVIASAYYWGATAITSSEASLGFIFTFLILILAFWMIAQNRTKK